MKYRVILIVFILSTLLFCCRGSGSHSIECVFVGEQKVCFIREVWGLNGDIVSLTTSDNSCHKPSGENDFVSDSLGAGEQVYYKVVEGKLHVWGSSTPMLRPNHSFPVEVIFDDFDPLAPNKDFLIESGFKQANLGQSAMTWCATDIF